MFSGENFSSFCVVSLSLSLLISQRTFSPLSKRKLGGKGGERRWWVRFDGSGNRFLEER
jgi:hypothetical protein